MRSDLGTATAAAERPQPFPSADLGCGVASPFLAQLPMTGTRGPGGDRQMFPSLQEGSVTPNPPEFTMLAHPFGD